MHLWGKQKKREDCILSEWVDLTVLEKMGGSSVSERAQVFQYTIVTWIEDVTNHNAGRPSFWESVVSF